MKRLIRKIEDRIAIRFLKRELSLEYAGKLLALAFNRIIKDAVKDNTKEFDLMYEIICEKGKFYVKNKITVERIPNVNSSALSHSK